MALEHGRALDFMGEKVSYLCAPDTHMAELCAVNFPVVTARPPNSRFSYKTIRDVVRVLHQERPDIILTHNNRESLNVRAARFFSGLEIPIIHVAHCDRLRYIKHTADAFIAVSDSVATALEEKGISPEFIRVSQNFIRTIDAQPISHRQSNPQSNKPVIGFLGRLANEKNPELFVSLIEILRTKGYEARGYIGGSGKKKWQDRVENAIESFPQADIKYLGWVDDIDEFFDKVDILVVPSKREAFGLVILEAMARGVPVVSTRTSGSLQIISNGVNGLETQHDVNSISDAVIRLLADENLYVCIANNGLRTAQEYSMEARAASFLEAIQSLRERIPQKSRAFA